MKKLFYLMTILMVAACSKTAEQQKGTANETIAEPLQEEIIEVEESINETNTAFVGLWGCDAATCGIDISLDMRSDGTFTQLMGESKQEGTWEVMENGRMLVNTPNLKKPQEWEVKSINDDIWEVCWNPDAPKPKTVPFKRQS